MTVGSVGVLVSELIPLYRSWKYTTSIFFFLLPPFSYCHLYCPLTSLQPNHDYIVKINTHETLKMYRLSISEVNII